MSQNENYWFEILKTMENQIRQSQGHLVVLEIRKIQVQKIPRNYLADFSEMARRASDPLLALKILNSVIYPKTIQKVKATDKEKLTYASSLPLLGLNEEALTILSEVDAEVNPEVLLYSTFAYFGLWDYQKPVGLLKKYISSPHVNEYMKLVGRVNLIACYVSQFETQMAREWIVTTLDVAGKGQHWLLYGNILELEAQTYIQEKKYEEALKILEQAEKYLKESGGLYFAMVQKWQFVCKMMSGHWSDQLQLDLFQFQKQTQQNRLWEILRDCDLYLALSLQDQKKLEYVLNGTPMASFRHRAAKVLEQSLELKQVFSRQLGEGGGIYDSHDPQLLFQSTLSLALGALAKDFYKPVPLGALFLSLYPGQIFDPFTSPKRVMNTIYRLRKWFKKQKWTLEIETKNMEFSLKGQGILKIYRRKLSREHLLLQYFCQKFHPKTFTSLEFAQKMGVSKRFSVGVIKHGIKEKKIIAYGRGRATRYKLSNHWIKAK